MARHSNGQENYKPAGWVIAVAIAVIVAVIALLFFLLGGDDNDDVNNAADSETSAQAPAETDEAAEESESVAPSAESATSETSEAAESEDKEAASSEPATPSEKAPAPAAASADTLILLDTSAGLARQFDQVTGAWANTAHALGAEGNAVALWTSPPPLTPGVTVGYRANLALATVTKPPTPSRHLARAASHSRAQRLSQRPIPQLTAPLILMALCAYWWSRPAQSPIWMMLPLLRLLSRLRAITWSCP